MSNREVLWSRVKALKVLPGEKVREQYVADLAGFATQLLELVNDYDSALLSAEGQIEQLKQEANA